MPAKLRINGNGALVTESWIAEENMLRRTHKKSGRDEQHTACRYLRGKQHLAKSGSTLPLPCDLQGRRETEKERGREHHPDGEEHNAPVRSRSEPFGRIEPHKGDVHDAAA